MCMVISSNQNEKIKFIRKIRDDSKTRKESKLYLAEGITLFTEIDEKLIDSYYIDEDKYESIAQKIGTSLVSGKKNVYKLKSSVFETIVDTKSSQGICALVSMNTLSLDEFIGLCNKNENVRIVILENVSDPGNIGTILRSSLAFDISGVIVDAKCADVYSPKVVRSSMGGIFKQNIYISENLEKDIKTLKDNKVKIYATSPSTVNTKNCKDIDFEKENKLALIFGNEAHGISKNLMEESDTLIRLDMSDKIESLNVAVCASICMFLMKGK